MRNLVALALLFVSLSLTAEAQQVVGQAIVNGKPVNCYALSKTVVCSATIPTEEASLPNANKLDTAAGFPLTAVLWWVGSIILTIITLSMLWSIAIGPRWNVWKSHQTGLADLAQANNEQQIQIAEAKGRLDAAQLNKQAAIVEAEAVAAQIEAIGTQLTEHDLYLRWQWIKMMEDRDSKADTIYVPTEANLPVLEAARFTK